LLPSRSAIGEIKMASIPAYEDLTDGATRGPWNLLAVSAPSHEKVFCFPVKV